MGNQSREDFTFHHWQHIMSLSKKQKRHFIQSKITFQQQNYSLLITNLCTGIDNVAIRYNKTMNESEDANTTNKTK
jgi:hypothetical protein